MEMKNVKELFIGGPKEIVIADTVQSFTTSSTTYASYTYLNSYSTSQSNLGQENTLKINFSIISNQGSPYIESMLTYYDENGTLKRPEFTINGTSNYDLTIKLTGEVSSSIWEVLLIEQYDSNGTGNNMRVQLAKTGSSNLEVYVKNEVATSMFTLRINSIKLIKAVGVKKITNANGDIIWGSYEEFPYRRLEYIQGDGKNYVVTNANVTLTSGTEYWFQMAFDQNNPTNALSGAEKSNAYTTNDRFKFGTSGNGYLMCGYANGFTTNTQPVKDRFYEFHAMQGSQYIKDLSTDTIIGTGTYSLTGTNHGGSHIALFGITQGSDTNLLQVSSNNGTRIKLFRLK